MTTDVKFTNTHLTVSASRFCRPKSSFTAEFYTSDELRQLELDKLFKAGWICLGRTGELSAVGDYFTAYLIGEPVIVVRSTPAPVAR